MKIKDRNSEILEFLRDRREASVKELAGHLYVSEPTMRRALAELERSGQIIRTHGAEMKFESEMGVGTKIFVNFSETVKTR